MGRIIRFFLASFVLMTIIYGTFVRAEYPGVTGGSFSVSDSGTANYVLPISTPAGVAGMSPDLAVTYSSQAGNGLMGVGFGLSGMSSSIHRCGSSHIVDGKATGVKYDDTDMICMNGQRLIRISGTHWRNGTVYRTEVDSFDKVVYRTGTTSLGTATDYFEVYTRDGEKHIYNWRVGVSSVGLSVRRNVSSWLKHVEEDRSGNRIHYRYKSMTEGDGERFLPDQIVWGAKNLSGANRKVVFEYTSNRPDKRFSYSRGIKSESKHRLSKIKTYIDDNLVKEYKFSYQKSPVSGLSRLIWVQQCGFEGNCLPRHEFTWKDTARGFSWNTTDANGYKLPVRIYDYQDQYEIASQSGDFIDVNNDGLVDYVVSYKDYTTKQDKHKIYKNTGSGWQPISQTPPTSFVMRDFTQRRRNIQRGTYADVNGDGYPDIVHSYSVLWWGGHLEERKEVWINNQNWTWSRSSTFIPPTYMWGYSAWSKANSNTSIDTDIFTPRESGTFNYTQMTKAHLADINGDGLVDWVVSYRNFELTDRQQVWLNSGTRWVPTSGNTYKLPLGAVFDDYWEYNAKSTPSIRITQLEDINGDGLLDLVRAVRYKRGALGVTQLDLRDTWLNTGSGWKYSSDYKLPDYVLDYTRVQVDNGGGRDFTPQTRGNFVDVNGDGLVDWVRSYKDGINNKDYKYTWLNTGKGWVANTDYELRGAVINDYSSSTGNHKGHPSGSFFDINRDGLVDWIVAYKNKSGTLIRYTYLNTGSSWSYQNPDYKFPNMLIDNNLGWERSSVRYGSLMDLNGDGAVDYLMSADNIYGNPVIATYLGNAKPADVLQTITDSLDAVTTIRYKPMTDNSVYRIGAAGDQSYRSRRVTGPNLLVSDTWQSNGIGGNSRLQYFYYYARDDGKRGYQGFAQRRVWDPVRNMLSIKDLYQHFPATGMIRRELVYKTDAVTDSGGLTGNYQVLSQKLNFIKRKSTFTDQGSVLNYDKHTFANGNVVYRPRIRRSRKIDYELDQTGALRSIWTETGFDAYLNPKTVRVVTVPGAGGAYENLNLTNNFYTLTQTTFENNETDWLIGLAKDVKATHHAPGSPTQVRETQIIYKPNGLPETTIIEPNQSAYSITTVHDYDAYGNEISTTISGLGVEDRTTITTYDQRGMHARTKTNALGHSMSMTYHNRCDAPETVTDANQQVTTTIYDQFCRVKQVNYPDGTSSFQSFANNPPRTNKRRTGTPWTTTTFDELGRGIKTQTKGFDGRTIFTEKQYNWKGQVTQASLPYYEGDTVYWTKYFYDAIGRNYLTRTPDNSETRRTFNGLTTVSTNPLGQTQTRIVDVAGRLKTVLDADGNAIDYNYDSVGNLLNTTDPMGNQVKIEYDHLGRKKKMDDPNMGIWTYDYDVLGQLIKQTDAKEQIITTEYDLLGRMENRVVKSNNGPDEVSTWKYDTAANGIGALDYTTGPNGYFRQHSYDSLSRPVTMQETINGITLSSAVTYNSSGRLKTMRYPGHGGYIYYGYNAYGYLSRVYHNTEVDGQNTLLDLWVPEAVDAKGNITQERYGNGVNILRSYHSTQNYLTDIESILGSTIIQDLEYTMDSIGNLKSRADALQNTSESFTYDNLNRLKLNTATVPDPTLPRSIRDHPSVL